MNFVKLEEAEKHRIYGGVYDLQFRQLDRLLMWLLTGHWME